MRRYKIELTWRPSDAPIERLSWANGSLTYDSLAGAAFRAGAIVASAPRINATVAVRIVDRRTDRIAATASSVGEFTIRRALEGSETQKRGSTTEGRQA